MGCSVLDLDSNECRDTGNRYLSLGATQSLGICLLIRDAHLPASGWKRKIHAVLSRVKGSKDDFLFILQPEYSKRLRRVFCEGNAALSRGSVRNAEEGMLPAQCEKPLIVA